MRNLLTPEQIQENWDAFMKVIDDSIKSERKQKVLDMYSHFEDRMMLAPASGRDKYHSCYPGGYVLHILKVCNCVQELYESWKLMGSHPTYTYEEMMFSTIHHDLGKIGDKDKDYYLPNDSDWHIRVRGEHYMHNPKLTNMSVPDRSTFLLQEFGISYSEEEFIAIKLHDGLYNEANKQYLATIPERGLKSHLPLLLHHADHMSTRIEFEQEQAGVVGVFAGTPPIKKADSKAKTTTTKPVVKAKAPIKLPKKEKIPAKLFEDLFSTPKK